MKMRNVPLLATSGYNYVNLTIWRQKYVVLKCCQLTPVRDAPLLHTFNGFPLLADSGQSSLASCFKGFHGPAGLRAFCFKLWTLHVQQTHVFCPSITHVWSPASLWSSMLPDMFFPPQICTVPLPMPGTVWEQHRSAYSEPAGQSEREIKQRATKFLVTG